MWFTSILHNRYLDWCSEFYKLYKLETIEEFESQWDVTVSNFDPQDNKHVKGLYLIKKILGASLSSELLLWRNNHHRNIGINVLKSPLEKQASRVLTLLAFEKFKEECSSSIQYLILYVSGNNFILRYYEGSHIRNHQVFWDGNIIMCSCKKFEFFGILCCHILWIFLQKDSDKIPSAYLPSCWCLQHHSHELDVLEGQILIDNDPLMAANDILCPPNLQRKCILGRSK
ncbi:hypothetical protein Cgig2_000167 [Carnegiea gigantea]|uniref:Protein FAR1-RELATED SEQUENCE n=1 Tax=Carnegiea gigantea TaxID=171969 RepID=A0A9Q1KMU5_9CARY|nr:hypothetical protein Cgig2_000167 [Carnegiea gigantea]